MRLGEVEDERAQGSAVEEHRQDGGGDGGHPPGAGFQPGVGPGQVTPLLEEQPLVALQGVSGRHVAVQGTVLPEDLSPVPVALVGGEVQALPRLVHQQDRTCDGVQGLQGRDKHHPEHLLLGAGGGELLGDRSQTFAQGRRRRGWAGHRNEDTVRSPGSDQPSSFRTPLPRCALQQDDGGYTLDPRVELPACPTGASLRLTLLRAVGRGAAKGPRGPGRSA